MIASVISAITSAIARVLRSFPFSPQTSAFPRSPFRSRVTRLICGALSVGLLGFAGGAQAGFKYQGGPYNSPSGCYVTHDQVYTDYWLKLWPVHNPNGDTYSLLSSTNAVSGVSYNYCTAHPDGTGNCEGHWTDFWGACSLYDEKNLGCKTHQVGNPCEPATGNKYQEEEDFRNGDGLLRFSRAYNSLLGKDGSIGFGWSSTYHAQLELGSAELLVRRGDGRGEYFSKNAAGQWVGGADTTLTLTQDAAGYTLSATDGTGKRYGNDGKLRVETDRAGKTTTYAYNADGQLIAVTDAFGHTLTFAYEANGRVRALTTPAGGVYSYSYDTAGNLIQITYPDNTAKRYHYENIAFPHHLTGISYVNSAGVVARFSTYAYDASGKTITTQHAVTSNGAPQENYSFNYLADPQTTVTDAAGTQEVRTFSINLGVKNLIAKHNHGDNKLFTQTFDANNNLTCEQDEEGRVTTYAYNAANQKLSETQGQGGSCTAPVPTAASRTTTYQYLSPSLTLPTVIASASVYASGTKRTEIVYDANRNPVIITQRGFTPSGTPVSRTVTLAYNPMGQVTAIDGPRTDLQDITTLTYYTCTTGGACGQLSSVTNVLGHTTTYDSYDATGRVTEITDPNGVKTTYAYDLRGHLLSATVIPPVGLNRLTQYTYDNVGNLTQVIFPDGKTLHYTYDAALYLRSITDNLGNRIEYRYDLKGNRIQELTKDPSGTLARSIETAYDIRNKISQINTGGSITKLVHDAIGNLTKATDPKQSASATPVSTTYTYDALNRLLTTIDNLSGQTQYAYDVNDKVKQTTAPNSATTAYTRDDLGNVLTETSPDRGTLSYTYDQAGNIKTATDARGMTASYSYDALNRLTQGNYPDPAENITYTYDIGATCSRGIGRLCQTIDAGGTSQYSYDAFGNSTTHTRTEGGHTYTTSYSYDPANRLSAITYPDGKVVSYTRNSIGQITQVTTTVNGSPVTLSSNRTYRADGLLTAQTFGNTLTETKGYDLQGRLTNQVLGTVDNRTYTYDANGNATVTAFGNFSYDVLDRLIQETLATSSQSFTYDPNGNRTADGSGTYGYITASNRLNSAPSGSFTLDASGNTTTDQGGTRSFTYNNAGQLTQVTIAGTSTSYTYNTQRQRTKKITATQTTVYHYDITGNLIAETNPNGSLIRDYVYTDTTPIAKIEAGITTETLAYVHTDHLATPRFATNGQGIKVWSWEGNAFGDNPSNEDPDNDGILTTVNLRFPGQYFDSETGLFYNWNRYYDPRTGRYVSSDPIGLKGGMNTYAYAESNPLTFTDPDGLFVRPIPIGPILGPKPPIVGGPKPVPYPIDPVLPAPGPPDVIPFPPPAPDGFVRCHRTLKKESICHYKCDDGTTETRPNSCDNPCPSYFYKGLITIPGA